MSAPLAKKRRMALTAAIVVGAVVSMTGLAFAAVPLYQAFCKATGYGGTTQTARAAADRMLDRTIDVRFDANVAADLPIEFQPVERSQRLRLGETGLAFFRVRNTSDKPVTAVASYNVAPYKVGVYFQKLECFCFQARVLAPGETAQLPVIYFVDPELASDRETEEVREVTLSYTFFRSADEAVAAAAAGSP